MSVLSVGLEIKFLKKYISLNLVRKDQCFIQGELIGEIEQVWTKEIFPRIEFFKTESKFIIHPGIDW